MEGCASFVIACVLGTVAGYGTYEGWFEFIGVPALVMWIALVVGFTVFLLAIMGIGVLVIGE